MTAVQAAPAYTHADGFRADFPEASRCTATNRAGARCKRPAPYPPGVCALHGGAAPQVRRAQAERWLREQFGAPGSQLARWHRELCETAPTNPYLALRDLNTACHHLAAVLASQLTDADYRGPSPAFCAYERSLDRAARVAKLCGDLGIAERQLSLQELQGEAHYQLLTAAFDGTPSITREQREEWSRQLRLAFERLAQRQAALPATSTPGQPDGRLPLRGATP